MPSASQRSSSKRKAATDFSFFLAIPTLIGAGVYSLYKERALLSVARKLARRCHHTLRNLGDQVLAPAA